MLNITSCNISSEGRFNMSFHFHPKSSAVHHSDNFYVALFMISRLTILIYCAVLPYICSISSSMLSTAHPFISFLHVVNCPSLHLLLPCSQLPIPSYPSSLLSTAHPFISFFLVLNYPSLHLLPPFISFLPVVNYQSLHLLPPCYQLPIPSSPSSLSSTAHPFIPFLPVINCPSLHLLPPFYLCKSGLKKNNDFCLNKKIGLFNFFLIWYTNVIKYLTIRLSGVNTATQVCALIKKHTQLCLSRCL